MSTSDTEQDNGSHRGHVEGFGLLNKDAQEGCALNVFLNSMVDKANTATKSTQGLHLAHDLYSDWLTKGTLHIYSRISERLSHHLTQHSPNLRLIRRWPDCSKPISKVPAMIHTSNGGIVSAFTKVPVHNLAPWQPQLQSHRG